MSSGHRVPSTSYGEGSLGRPSRAPAPPPTAWLPSDLWVAPELLLLPLGHTPSQTPFCSKAPSHLLPASLGPPSVLPNFLVPPPTLGSDPGPNPAGFSGPWHPVCPSSGPSSLSRLRPAPCSQANISNLKSHFSLPGVSSRGLASLPPPCTGQPLPLFSGFQLPNAAPGSPAFSAHASGPSLTSGAPLRCLPPPLQPALGITVPLGVHDLPQPLSGILS